MKSRYNATVNLIFAVVFVLGIAISSLVYLRSENIIEFTLELVETQIPHYDSFQKFHAALTEQERYLYEYYATQGSEYYSVGYSRAEGEAKARLAKLTEDFGTTEQIIEAQKQLTQIGLTAKAFHQNMLEGPDWDLAREQLFSISRARRAILPQTQELKDQVALQVQASHEAVASASNEVRLYVIVHFFAMLLISFVVARAIKSAMESNSFSQRLALFPKRNPNPVFSLDENNQVTFSNPATNKLLQKLELPEDDATALITPEIESYKNQVCYSEDAFTRFEYSIKGTVLSCELHWLSDVNQWDIHITDITAQKRAEEELKYQASHHPETYLCNQYALEDFVKQHTSGEHYTSPFTMTIVSVADFDRLQVSKGHESAQLIVNQLATSLVNTTNKQTQQNAHVYQVGDSHFAIVHCSAADTSDAEQLIRDIEEHIACSLFHFQYQPQLHYGITQYPKYGTSMASLLQTARNALDNVTPDSERVYCVYDKEMGEKVSKELKMTEDIKSAIAADEFQLHYQPQVDIKTGNIIGAEVLIRWPRQSGWVSPAEFIPLAERSGLIIPLGNWILRTACIKAKSLVDKGNTDLVMAVNISPKQFGRKDFLTTVQTILEETGLPPRNLELEITEGVIMYNESHTIESLHKLKQLGVMLAIDDFGTGYSSLSYLKQFPIDKLKIDQSFVRDMHTDKDDESIVRTVLDLGKNLNLKLIAEGVEEQAQWDLLADIGCDEIQGYFFSRPLAAEKFEEFMLDASTMAEKSA